MRDLLLAQRGSADSDPSHAAELIALIQDLPTNQRIATHLRHVEGWTGSEIAELLGVTTSTAYVHVYRGTRRVRERWLAKQLVFACGALAGLAAAVTGWLERRDFLMSPFTQYHDGWVVASAPWQVGVVLALVQSAVCVGMAVRGWRARRD